MKTRIWSRKKREKKETTLCLFGGGGGDGFFVCFVYMMKYRHRVDESVGYVRCPHFVWLHACNSATTLPEKSARLHQLVVSSFLFCLMLFFFLFSFLSQLKLITCTETAVGESPAMLLCHQSPTVPDPGHMGGEDVGFMVL